MKPLLKIWYTLFWRLYPGKFKLELDLDWMEVSDTLNYPGGDLVILSKQKPENGTSVYWVKKKSYPYVLNMFGVATICTLLLAWAFPEEHPLTLAVGAMGCGIVHSIIMKYYFKK